MILMIYSALWSRVAPMVQEDPTTDATSAAALIDALRAPSKRAETTNVVAVDEHGNGCVITTSLGLGSGVWVPGYGVHLNSMMGEGELVRGLVHPGTRMGSMMSPLIALDDHGQLAAIAGAAGGSRIRPALVQCVLRMLRGAAPQDAIDAPRLNALPDLVRLEPGFFSHVIRSLEAAGYQDCDCRPPRPILRRRLRSQPSRWRRRSPPQRLRDHVVSWVETRDHPLLDLSAADQSPIHPGRCGSTRSVISASSAWARSTCHRYCSRRWVPIMATTPRMSSSVDHDRGGEPGLTPAVDQCPTRQGLA